jgi:hypothetical protein
MIPIFLATNTGHAGKTFVAIGLVSKLKEQGYRVGYIKPYGRTPVKKDKDLFEADAVFMKEALDLPEPMDTISPFVQSYETETLLLHGTIKDVKKRIMNAFRSMKDRDYVIIGGATNLWEGFALNIDGLTLIENMEAQVLFIEPWRGTPSLDSFLSMKRLLGNRFLGGVINKTPESLMNHVKETIRPFLKKKGVRVFGIFHQDRLLESITVRRLNEILNGKVLCCESILDEFVENFSIGAMDVDSALGYFMRTPNKAVITGVHRTDIQLAAMETSTKCIILTGGFYTNDVILGKARSKGISLISVAEDTFTVVDKIEAVMGKISIREKGKIDRAKELVYKNFDLQGFLKSLKRGR